jgi:hypothetical protein
VVVDGRVMREAYALAERLASSMTRAERGHCIVWVRDACFGVMELGAESGTYAIVGRHTHADVSLAMDPTVALRHLVLRSIDAGDGQAALRIVDLQTELGFALEDGVPRRSAIVRGPVAIQVGEYVVVGLPNGELPPALPPAVLEELSSPYRAPGRRALGSSHVGLVPGVSDLGKMCLCIDGDARYSFSIERGGRRETVVASEIELQRGILVGRSPKAPAGLLALMDERISRMHVLLVRERSETFLVDLCSMNGTWMGRARVRRVRLADGLQVRIGDGHLVLTWQGRT